MKELDFWRALGVGAGSILVWLAAGAVLYPAYEVHTADQIMLAVSAVVLAIFSVVYFKGSHIHPTLPSGFYLGLVMFAYNVAMGFIGGFAAAAQGAPQPMLPAPSVPVMLAGIVIGLGVPALVGWYLGKK